MAYSSNKHQNEFPSEVWFMIGLKQIQFLAGVCHVGVLLMCTNVLSYSLEIDSRNGINS